MVSSMSEHTAENDALHLCSLDCPQPCPHDPTAENDAPTCHTCYAQTATARADAWDVGYACGLGDYGKGYGETCAANPYRAATEVSAPTGDDAR